MSLRVCFPSLHCQVTLCVLLSSSWSPHMICKKLIANYIIEQKKANCSRERMWSEREEIFFVSRWRSWLVCAETFKNFWLLSGYHRASLHALSVFCISLKLQSSACWRTRGGGEASSHDHQNWEFMKMLKCNNITTTTTKNAIWSHKQAISMFVSTYLFASLSLERKRRQESIFQQPTMDTESAYNVCKICIFLVTSSLECMALCAPDNNEPRTRLGMKRKKMSRDIQLHSTLPRLIYSCSSVTQQLQLRFMFMHTLKNWFDNVCDFQLFPFFSRACECINTSSNHHSAIAFANSSRRSCAHHRPTLTGRGRLKLWLIGFVAFSLSSPPATLSLVLRHEN